MNLINCITLLILAAFTIATAPPIDVVFIIQNQDTKYQSELSRKLKENIIQQSAELPANYRIQVHLLHEIFNYPGGWTIHNLIPQLMLHQMNANTHSNQEKEKEIFTDNTRWIVFCEDRTRVRLKLLMGRLNYENHTQPLYLGHPLYDREPTIIHHFAFFENPKWFPYPLLRAGVVFSMPLFKRVADIYANRQNKHFKQQFSIDAGHELARFIYDNIQISLMTLTTSEQHHTSTNSLPTSYQERNTVFNKDNTSTTIKLKPATLSHRDTFNTDGAPNFFDLSHSDICTMSTNETKDEYRNEFSKRSVNASSNIVMKSSFIKKKKIILKNASYICSGATRESRRINEDESCAMYAEQNISAASSMTCTPVKQDEIYFAVKTCSKYHNERLPIIQSTWAPYAKHIKYFSDTEDDTIPTSKTGVVNVEMGHCAKTLQILQLALKDIETYNQKQQNFYQVNEATEGNNIIKWLLLSDDDTLLSVSGVCHVLGCYNSMDEIYLGERYGYRLYAQDGFNYITGGGGIAFSLPVVKLVLQHCSCPSPAAPDDMILGSCLHSLQLKPLHSSRFHQARPNDYPWELLKQEPPVSFHKFWQLDPIDVYNRWFAAQDRTILIKETAAYEKVNVKDYSIKPRKIVARTQVLNLNKIPLSVMTSLHHSKERHVDLK